MRSSGGTSLGSGASGSGWASWRCKRLAEGRYRGELYDIGFDRPEAHVVSKGGRHYYAFYAERWDGEIELRGLGPGRYTVTDYWSGRTIGTASKAESRLQVAFERFLMLEATPLEGTAR